MLHPIEIKANIEGRVGQALATLGDPVPETKRQIWFAEDRSGLQAGGQLNMLSRGIILRIRSGEGPDDSTAKLRPVDAEQLTKQWSEPFKQEPLKYRIEGDWSGDRHVLAASAETSHPEGSLSEFVGGGRFDQVFTLSSVNSCWTAPTSASKSANLLGSGRSRPQSGKTCRSAAWTT